MLLAAGCQKKASTIFKKRERCNNQIVFNGDNGRVAFTWPTSLQGDGGKTCGGRETGWMGEQSGGDKNKESHHNVVCGLSFLRENDGVNDGNDGGEGMGAFPGFYHGKAMMAKPVMDPTLEGGGINNWGTRTKTRAMMWFVASLF
jgi:hypothetical protein